jgi:type I restriction enzyme M protein
MTFNEASKKVEYKPFDILLVNDGRYKIGNTCILTLNDNEIVIQSHIRIIRVLNPEIIDPFLLIYLLNTKIVQDQIKHKTFIQSTIATLGNRLREILIPIPKDPRFRKDIADTMRNLMLSRSQLLNEIRIFLDAEKENLGY